ncbi:MAG: hypothetical protein ACXVH6_06040 [Halobacteriota archaeon]
MHKEQTKAARRLFMGEVGRKIADDSREAHLSSQERRIAWPVRVTPLFFIFLIVVSAAVNAQTGTGVGTARVDFGTVGRGGSAEREVILYNTGGNSTLAYSIKFTNVTNTSGQLSATPASVAIAPNSNVTVAVRLDVPSDAKDGNFSSRMLVNTTSAVRPVLSAAITYTVQGNAPAQTAQGVDVPLVAGALAVFALVAIGAVYVILLRGK